MIARGPYKYDRINAAAQRRDAHSMLNWTERIMRMRKEVPELGWGDFRIVETSHRSVLAVRYDWRNNTVVTLHNLADDALEVELRLGDERGRKLVNLLSEAHSDADARGRHRITLDPYGYCWYRAGGLGYLLDRTPY